MRRAGTRPRHGFSLGNGEIHQRPRSVGQNQTVAERIKRRTLPRIPRALPFNTWYGGVLLPMRQSRSGLRDHRLEGTQNQLQTRTHSSRHSSHAPIDPPARPSLPDARDR
jgi:hypothetical protein